MEEPKMDAIELEAKLFLSLTSKLKAECSYLDFSEGTVDCAMAHALSNSYASTIRTMLKEGKIYLLHGRFYWEKNRE